MGGIGMSGGMSESSTKQKSRNYPKWAMGQMKDILPKLDQLMSFFQPGGGPLREQATGAMSDALTGKGSDEALARVLANVKTNSGEMLDRSLQRAGSGAARTGNLYSTAYAKQRGQIGRQSQSDLDTLTSQLSYGNEQQKAARKMQAVAPAMNLESMPFAQMMSLFNYLKGLEGMQSSSTSAMNMGGSAKFPVPGIM